jgi:hypothetical protein
MPGKAKGTVGGRRTTSKQQKLFGMARGMQEGTVPKRYSPEAAKIARTIGPRDLSNIAKKPAGGFRKTPKKK